MGDVIHNLPVVADIRRHHPGAQIDWVVEESFADIPGLHPGVGKVIRVANRRWRRSWFSIETWRELRAFKSDLQREHYNCVLDTQGLVKSAVIARMARGRCCGYSPASAREPISARFYDARFDVPGNLHAVERNRMLVAVALGYIPQRDVDYGIRAFPPHPHPLPRGEREHHSSIASSSMGHPLPLRPFDSAQDMPCSEQAPGQREPSEAGRHRYAVLLHASSRADKEWDTRSWAALGDFLNSREIEVLLPWGSEAERAQSERLKALLMHAFVPARMPLAKLAKLLAEAEIVIGADTGLTHLAVALGRPTIGIYRGSDPRLTGLYGSPKALNLGDIGRAPDPAEVIAAAERLLV